MTFPAQAEGGDLLRILCELWPQAFNLEPLGSRPLKIGITADLVATGAITHEEAGAALRCYVGRPRYLRAVRPGAIRIDLDGNPAGAVTADQAAYAQTRLARLDRRRDMTRSFDALGTDIHPAK